MWKFIYNGKLANEIPRLSAIVVKNTVSLSRTLKIQFATPGQMDGESKLQ